MRILVTGGAGFIGSNLALALQARHPKAEIVVLDDFSCGTFQNLRGFRGDVVTANMCEPAWTMAVSDALFDQIYHLQANSDTRVTDQALMMRQNTESFRLLLEYAAEAKTPIVYASSAATYGQREGRMRESDPVEPANVYAFSKGIMENIARAATTSDEDWKIVGVRYFNVYGPREAHKGVPSSMAYHLSHQMVQGKRPRIFEFGEQKRDFVYVDDAVEGTIRAMEAPVRKGVFNIGSGQARSFNDLVAALNTALGMSLEPEYFANPYSFYQSHTEADLAMSTKELGYKPRYSLEDGVDDYMRKLHPGHVARVRRGKKTRNKAKA